MREKCGLMCTVSRGRNYLVDLLSVTSCSTASLPLSLISFSFNCLNRDASKESSELKKFSAWESFSCVTHSKPKLNFPAWQFIKWMRALRLIPLTLQNSVSASQTSFAITAGLNLMTGTKLLKKKKKLHTRWGAQEKWHTQDHAWSIALALVSVNQTFQRKDNWKQIFLLNHLAASCQPGESLKQEMSLKQQRHCSSLTSKPLVKRKFRQWTKWHFYMTE